VQSLPTMPNVEKCDFDIGHIKTRGGKVPHLAPKGSFTVTSITLEQLVVRGPSFRGNLEMPTQTFPDDWPRPIPVQKIMKILKPIYLLLPITFDPMLWMPPNRVKSWEYYSHFTVKATRFCPGSVKVKELHRSEQSIFICNNTLISLVVWISIG